MNHPVQIGALWIACMVVGVIAAAIAPAHAQTAAPSASRPQAGQPPDDRAAVLTAAQLAKVKSVLAAYKPAALTADDAKAIKRTFRDAGIRHTPALDKAITDAGFSPARLEALDPRPPRPPGDGPAPGNGPAPAGGPPRP